MDVRHNNFCEEMKNAEVVRKNIAQEHERMIAYYISFLRKCYHGKCFESRDFKNGEILPIDIAQKMQEEFKKQFGNLGIARIPIENIYNYDDVN